MVLLTKALAFPHQSWGFSHSLVQNIGTCLYGLMHFRHVHLSLLVIYLVKLHMCFTVKWMRTMIFHVFKIFFSFWTSTWMTWENMICLGKKKLVFSVQNHFRPMNYSVKYRHKERSNRQRATFNRIACWSGCPYFKFVKM